MKNLPALKPIKKGGISIPKKTIAPISKKDLERKRAVAETLESESLAQEMNRKRGLDLVLVGDLTGSMSSYHTVLKNKFSELCSELFPLIPNLRIGIIFYLDHDRHLPYVTRFENFTTDIERLKMFINNTPSDTYGNSTFDESVEDALNDLHKNMSWSEMNTRSVVLFGDAQPHEPSECPYQYDYFELTKSLYNQNTTINSVYCGGDSLNERYQNMLGDFSTRVQRLGHGNFFSWIAGVTGGVAITIRQIDDLIDIIKAMAAKDAGKLDELEETLKLSSRPIPPILGEIKKKSITIEQKKQSLRLTHK